LRSLFRSPALIPKPKDWGSHLSVSGFFFLPLASTYKPPDDLVAFLNAGPPPVYIGFGSIIVDDPNALTTIILQAVTHAKVRALISKGWGGLGNTEIHLPENVFMLGNCPHDWLFPRVSCVVHHGGAGTMAAGIAAGKPTVIVPFFGDQPFWGDMVARAGAGPAPIPFKRLTAPRLASAIIEALQPAMTERAVELGSLINQEKGAETAASLFYSQLPLAKMHCSVCPDRIAVWRVSKTDIRLSAMTAAVLGREGLLDFDRLKL
jgi:UDP:flavonoid glycosyltransferase YjiC (YdhE family)